MCMVCIKILHWFQIKITNEDILNMLPETSANYRPFRFHPIDEERHKEKGKQAFLNTFVLHSIGIVLLGVIFISVSISRRFLYFWSQ